MKSRSSPWPARVVVKVAAMLLAGACGWAPPVFGQEATAKPAAAPAAPAASVVDQTALEAARSTLVSPFLLGIDPGKPASGLGGRLKELLRETDAWAVKRFPDAPERRAFLEALEGMVEVELAKALGGEAKRAAAAAQLAEARKEVDQGTTDHLYRSLMCWCPTENWTRNLAGCAEECADEQKGLIKEWLAARLSADEIIKAMVARGGPKVRALPEASGSNWIGYLFPFALLGSALVVLVVVILHYLRRAPPAAPLAPGAAPGIAADLDSDEGGDWGKRIERELKEMEN